MQLAALPAMCRLPHTLCQHPCCQSCRVPGPSSFQHCCPGDFTASVCSGISAVTPCSVKPSQTILSKISQAWIVNGVSCEEVYLFHLVIVAKQDISSSHMSCQPCLLHYRPSNWGCYCSIFFSPENTFILCCVAVLPFAQLDVVKIIDDILPYLS